MDEYTADAYANRDEAIPVLSFDNENSQASHTKSKLERLKAHVPLGRHAGSESESEGQSGWSIQDRLFAK